MPTGFRQTTNNQYPQDRFPSYPIEFKFFGVIGEEVDSKIDSEEISEVYTLNESILEATQVKCVVNIQVYQKQTKSWEIVYNKSTPLQIQEIQTYNLSFNLPVSNIDKHIGSIKSGSLVGISKESITNSNIQSNLVQKIKIEVSPDSADLWKFSGLKLYPKALAEIEHSNKGVFSNISVKLSRSCFLDPIYFNAINKEITLSLTDDQINLDIRLRAIDTL